MVTTCKHGALHILYCTAKQCMQYTVDQEIFMLRIICVKNFRGVKFSFDPRNFFSGWQLQCGQVPGEFLVFSMLPSIGRARCRWLNIVVDHLVDVDLCPHLFIDHHRVIFFCMFNFCGWPWPQNYFNSKIFPEYLRYSVILYTAHRRHPYIESLPTLW